MDGVADAQANGAGQFNRQAAKDAKLIRKAGKQEKAGNPIPLWFLLSLFVFTLAAGRFNRLIPPRHHPIA